jgi:transcriptional regulator with XRE-family HTH domain
MSLSAYGKLESGATSIDTNRIYLLSQFFKKPFKSFFPHLTNSKEDTSLSEIGFGLEKLLESKDKLIGHLENEIVFLRKQIESSS